MTVSQPYAMKLKEAGVEFPNVGFFYLKWRGSSEGWTNTLYPSTYRYQDMGPSTPLHDLGELCPAPMLHDLMRCEGWRELNIQFESFCRPIDTEWMWELSCGDDTQRPFWLFPFNDEGLQQMIDRIAELIAEQKEGK